MPDGPGGHVRRAVLPAIIGYVIAIGLVAPRAAVAFYFALAVYLIVPFGEVARLLFRRSWPCHYGEQSPCILFLLLPRFLLPARHIIQCRGYHGTSSR